ncbi:enoyl-CoA hydratase-related protein [Dankookia sp. P2]|uniref:enoyl-CoA hydratase/isomerase family protein n=1 Tax=Dankookia sp. P2 TaxID=3423955 RepID=UPI003D670E03
MLFETTGGIATITLNRPDAGNAFTLEMLADWEKALRVCIADDAIRAVVLTGAGRIFCSGGDVKRMARVAAGGRDCLGSRPVLGQPCPPHPADACRSSTSPMSLQSMALRPAPAWTWH